MAKQNYYAVLGVKQSDDADTIKKTYRKLAKENHPDLHPGDTAAETRFKNISEAWEILGDEDKRKKYDAELAGGSKKNPFGTDPTAAKTAPQSRSTMNQADFENLMRGFDNYMSPESIKKSAEKKPGTNPIDTTSMFERYMGFTGPKKKK